MKLLEKNWPELVTGSRTTSPFLPRQIGEQEELQFCCTDQQGFHLLFMSAEMVAQSTPPTPYWVLTCRNQASLQAACRWAAIMRNRWPLWARLAQTMKYPVFDAYMRELLAEHPPMHVTATMLRTSDSLPEITLLEWVQSGVDGRAEEVVRHCFASHHALGRFMTWFNGGQNFNSAWELVQIAYQNGTDAIGQVLDGLAERRPRTPQQRRPKRRK